ncbi:TPA: ERF family protein [Bacillus cereus]|uniref:ERF superfamily protein n=1 Tax=Bacillus cereus 03BB108 TaxID=451709 RepID=A0AAN0SRM2_BACCE|nr:MULTISPECIES: ERF family protein [Bacillus cereus group]ABK88179.1 possible recombination protein, phage associated [Bacillus thuringiensis str. Al Hakam]AEW58629.1 recombination protein, phage associated [Bacillus cereus F837/76]AJH66271.1 ERF superfamily protein [Bacillus thuringiensis]AJI08631.1 ERF superfamily protein [Bacillus cereus 03BB108]QKH04555.1 ERF family protein [Bacillus cereus]
MNKSETITELAKALVKFNSEVNKIAKDADNPFFKNNYATLDTIIDEIRPILSKNGLSIMQIPSGDGQNVTLKTLLLHESGEWLESDELTMKPVKNDPQAVGSCITYARRYSLAAFLSLNTGEDDDGNGATYGKGNKPNQKSNGGQAPNKPQGNSSNGKASEKQMKMIHAKIAHISALAKTEKQTIEDTLKGNIGTDNLSEISSQVASKAIEVLMGWEKQYSQAG